MSSPLSLQVEPDLLDAFLLRLRAAPPDGPRGDVLAAYERAVDEIYRNTADGARRRALDRENVKLASTLALPSLVEQMIAEHERVQTGIARAILALARPGEQRADLHGSRAPFTLVVRLEVDVWLDATRAARVLRHELEHAADMLDPAFAYAPNAAWPGRTHGQRRLAQERFTALWCCAIDERLGRTGRERLASPDQYAGAFERLFDGATARTLVAELAGQQRLTHAELLARSAAPTPSGSFAPGAPCALCGFPTTEWAAELARERIAEPVRQDFPTWVPADGCCQRCFECYQGRVR